MNINTIIDNLKANLAAGTDGQIHLTEQSFLMDLLKERNSDTPFTVKVPWNKTKSVRFPMTCLVLLTFLFLFRCLVYALYWVLKKIRTLFVGKNKEEELSTSPRVNFILLLTILSFYIYLIVAMIVFLLGNILLFNPNSSINDRGAICMQQPCGVEKYVYLLNAAECWSNTGIKVLKGDEVEVTASGSFYREISDMYLSANKNRALHFERSDIAKNNNDALSEKTRDLFMYHVTEASKDSAAARFGSLLVQIKDDYQEPSYDSDEHKIIQLGTITDNHESPRFTANHAGVLNFSVNDIYLSERVISRIEACESLQKEFRWDAKKCKKIKSNVADYSTLWFNDNIGEVLLNITIHRNSSILDNPPNGLLMKCYMSLENVTGIMFNIKAMSFNPINNETKQMLSFILVILCIVTWLLVDCFKGHAIIERLKLIESVWLHRAAC